MIRVGTRRSPLAQAQADRVLARLAPRPAHKVLIESEGDLDATRPLHQMERPGAFTSVLTDAVLDGRIDAAVHSLKDLPLHASAGAPIVAVLARDDAADVLVHRDEARDATRPLGLAPGSRVGTSAPRRQAQLLDADPDLVPVDVRGNVGTRLKLLGTGILDALLMARAAFERLDLPLPEGCRAARLDPQRFPAGPGQGAIAVQARAGTEAARVLAGLDDAPTRACVELERALLARLGGGCGLALGAFATPSPQGFRVFATYAPPESPQRAVAVEGPPERVLAEAHAALTAPPPAPATAPARFVALTLPPEQVEDWRAPLAAGGWGAHAWPLIETRPTGAAPPAEAGDAAWLALPSPRAAEPAARAYADAPTVKPRVAALGAATARAARRRGLPVHVVSRGSTGASLAAEVARFPAPPGKVLVPQSTDALPDLAEGLRSRGFEPLAWVAYATRPVAQAPPFPGGASALVLTSPSNAEALAKLPARPDAPLLAFGETTARAMRDLGLPLRATLPRPTPSGLLEVLP